jgi:DNA-binding NarL/FixJ family response regulator
MRPLNVVVAQLDSKNTERLAASLYGHFRSVAVARSLEELREAIPKHRADVAIVDLELVGLPDLEDLHRTFRSTSIVCTHRLADEEMWASALAAGASDMCSSTDVDGVVYCTLRSLDALAASKAA